jgi:membrane protein implicated in regulation of membrane protease activity
MTWATFYLVCFFVGIGLSVLSLATSGPHLPHFLHIHLPHLHGSHLPHGQAAPRLSAGSKAELGRASLPIINFGTMTAFLAWFGATGYLLTQYSLLAGAAVLVIASAVGMLGGATIFWFVFQLLLTHDRELDPADYDRVGVIARIVSPIRAGGTGEIIFSQAGTRHTSGARSENGEALARGTEVIVTHYERGIAYVRRWEDMAGGEKNLEADN